MNLASTINKVAECLKKALIECRDFLVFLALRARNDTVLRVSSSLSYTSLIALVPLLSIALAIFSAFPVFGEVREQLQEVLLKNFVPSIGEEISGYFDQFINATAKLTTIGVVGLVIISILLLSTIENCYQNHPLLDSNYLRPLIDGSCYVIKRLHVHATKPNEQHRQPLNCLCATKFAQLFYFGNDICVSSQPQSKIHPCRIWCCHGSRIILGHSKDFQPTDIK